MMLSLGLARSEDAENVYKESSVIVPAENCFNQINRQCRVKGLVA